jgi:hypothetical protein
MGFNDIAIRCILRKIRLDIKDLDIRRVRYVKHIINLIIKAFLFGKDKDSLEAEDIIKLKI